MKIKSLIDVLTRLDPETELGIYASNGEDRVEFVDMETLGVGTCGGTKWCFLVRQLPVESMSVSVKVDSWVEVDV